ncbi:BTAD domain-containing putative transcriptional regulator [Streptomyces acidiscabies]|uniref:BTAD domain-containing putative transcriptional regulator n=1 Tax=Streptomyces acidiscabies TaxID=42234 RepID=UPI0009649B3B|nr:BTAD domain-containing putative transcriptional regulator [Streptomyces acidiscabies]GAV39534.1 transcriptional regulatory protein EmbR [Streptomyces acidiscabies]
MASSAASARLRILGPLRIWRDGVELDPGPRQQSYLLAILVARAGEPVSTSELVDLIWAEDVPASAVNILQKYVGALRRLLEPPLPAREAGSFLHRRGSSYLFTAGATTLDLVAFRDRVDAATAALTRHDHEAALDHYAGALGLWHGPAGDGIADGTPAVTVFAALDNEFYAACTAAAELAVSLGRPERVLAALRLAASMAPFDEPVLAALVGVLGAAGRQAEALSVFRQARDRLAEELGIDPGPALAEAQRRILTQTPAPRPAREEAGRPTAATLIGRTGELATLRRTVERALAGDTAIGVVEGEPGAGKTRLLEEAAAVAGRLGALTVWGTCLEGDGTPAMWLWEQALGRLVRDLPAPAGEQWFTGGLGGLLAAGDGANREVPDGNARFRLFEQVVALVGQASARRPTLLVLDDLQWADATSLLLLRHLAERLPPRTAIIGALRDRAPAVGPELSRALAAVGRLPGHRRLRLGPLGRADVAELVRHEVGQDPGDAVTRAIHARTSGNPFFVRELSRLLSRDGAIGDLPAAAGVPSTVHDVVRDRMAGLDDDARDLLHVAALIGRDVDLRLLSRATGVAAADCLRHLEPLRTLGLLEPGPHDPFSLRFAHDLVRESVSDTAPKQRATLMHLRIADALEQIHADDECAAERLAHHLWAAGPLVEPDRTARAVIHAGRRAAAKLAFESAGRLLGAAVQATRASGLMELEFSALTLLAIVVRREAGYDTSTFDLLERAEYLARALGRESEAADFLFIRLVGAHTSLENGRGQLARRMHELGQVSGDPVVVRYGRLAWGLHQWDIGNIGEAHRAFTEADVAAPGAETPLRRDGLTIREGPFMRAAMTGLLGDVHAALALVDTWDPSEDPYAASVRVYYTTMIASMAGDAEAARRAGERWAAAGLDRLRTQRDHYIRQGWCWGRALTGEDPEGAAAEAGELLAAHLLDPPQWGITYHYALIAEMWLAAGSPERADAALDRAEQTMRDYGQRYAEGLLLLLKARLLQARGASLTAVRAAVERARTRSTAGEAHLFARRAERFLSGLGEQNGQNDQPYRRP